MELLQTIIKEVEKAVEHAYGTKPANSLQLDLPPNPQLGDFTFPTFTLKDQYGENPKVIAEKVAKHISKNGIIISAKATGPYINVRLGGIFFKAACTKMKEKTKNGKCAMVEYLSPNTNKPLHLGHFRNGVLGTAMTNMLEHIGHTVIRANLINDRGIHICKSMIAWQKFANGATPESTGIKGDHFVGKYYVRFSEESKKDPTLIDEAQAMLKKWEEGDPETISLWEKMNNWVYAGFTETYKNAGFLFDVSMYESDTYKLGKDIIDDGLRRGILTRINSGAIVFELPEKTFGKNKDGSTKKVTVLREDGTSVYMTQDIGTALKKVTDHKLNASIYVVGSEQDNHFKCLFEILHALGYTWSKKCHHLSYGMVELPTGKMKSREGTSVDSDDLIRDMQELATEEIRKRDVNGTISKDEVNRRAQKIGLGAIKFYLAKTAPKQKLLFNPEESISFDGVTGPYCQYVYARARSMITKALSPWLKFYSVNYDLLGKNQAERTLAQKLILFESKLEKAVKNYNPAIVALSVYDLAKNFNQWYNKCRIIDHDDPETSKARLLLVHITALYIKKALELLGIEVLEQM